MKDQKLKLEENEDSHTLGGYRRCRCYSPVSHPRTAKASGIFTTTGRILFYNGWKENFGKLQVYCSEFHEWQIHLNTKHDALYCPYSLVPDPQNFSIFLKCESSAVRGWINIVNRSRRICWPGQSFRNNLIKPCVCEFIATVPVFPTWRPPHWDSLLFGVLATFEAFFIRFPTPGSSRRWRRL
jgi:hypothetical protein